MTAQIGGSGYALKSGNVEILSRRHLTLRTEPYLW